MYMYIVSQNSEHLNIVTDQNYLARIFTNKVKIYIHVRVLQARKIFKK